MRSSIASTLALGSVLLAGSQIHAMPIPIANYFDGTSSTINHANPGTGDLTLAGGATMTSPVTVPGGASAYAFDNSASTMGGTGGTAKTSVADAQSLLDAKTALTLTGWYKSDSSIAGLTRLFDRADGSVAAGQWSLYFDGDPNNLQLNIGGTALVSNPGFNVNGQWVFFAVSFDGGNVVKFYVGDEATAAAANGSVSTTATDIGSNSKPLTLGNRDNAGRAFDGWLFDFRVYSSALTPSEVEDVRASAIPEPATASLLALAGVVTLARRRRAID